MVEPEQPKEEENLIKVSAITRQLVLSKLAQFCTETRGVDLYFAYEAIQLLRSQCGDGILKEKYKKAYDKQKKRLEYIGVLLGQLKMAYDSIEKGELDDDQKVSNIKKLYKKGMTNIPLIQNIIFEVLYLYLEKTNLKYQTIPSTYFKQMERKYKVIGDEQPKEEDSVENK